MTAAHTTTTTSHKPQATQYTTLTPPPASSAARDLQACPLYPHLVEAAAQSHAHVLLQTSNVSLNSNARTIVVPPTRCVPDVVRSVLVCHGAWPCHAASVSACGPGRTAPGLPRRAVVNDMWDIHGAIACKRTRTSACAAGRVCERVIVTASRSAWRSVDRARVTVRICNPTARVCTADKSLVSV